MKVDFNETSDAWPPSSSWEQYERIRLQRLKEQRQRMENMKEVVQRYSRIINELECKNKFLEEENLQLRAYTQHNQVIQTKSCHYPEEYESIMLQLEKQRNIRQNCEITIDSLRKQIFTLTNNNLYPQKNHNLKMLFEIETDYEVLKGLYEQLKDEVYCLHKQNLSLKEVIRDQSRNCYAKDNFWKGQDCKPGMIRVSSSINVKSQIQNKKDPISTKRNIQNANGDKLSVSIKELNNNCKPNITTNNQISSNTKIQNKSKVGNGSENEMQRLLKQQIKKQEQLINRFKENQSKQLQLIEILKQQKSKICLCHNHGKSSKKILSSKQNNLVSFKN